MNSDIITTERLVLKPMALEEAELFYTYRSMEEVKKMQGWFPESLEDAELFIAKYSRSGEPIVGTWKQFGIYLHDSGLLIGDCGFNMFEEEQAGIGYTISPEFQRKGYGSEAVAGMLKHLFERMKLHRVMASTDPANYSSISLLEKLGFRKEGEFKKSIKINGEWKDDLAFGLLKEEYEMKR